MKVIELFGKYGKGKSALVDDEDYENLASLRWTCTSNGYAVTYRNHKRVFMHREVVSPATDEEVDHVNGNKLDNQRHNLRTCTRLENMRNQRVSKNNTSGYKGVCWDKRWKKWRAQTYINRKYIQIGGYQTKEEAAHAYNAAVIELFGPYARLNEVETSLK